MLTNYWKFKNGVSRHLDSSTTTQMAKIMVQYGRPGRPSWAESVRSSFGRTIMGKAIWRNSIEVRLWEGFQLGMLIRTPLKRIILICVCGWHKIGWKETKSWSDVENTRQRSRFGRNQHLSLIMNTWDVFNDSVKEVRILLTITEPCLNPEFPKKQLKKLPCWENLCISSWSYDMEGHAKKCVERYCELANKTTQQLY